MMTHAEWNKNNFEMKFLPKWFILSAFSIRVKTHFEYLVFYPFLADSHLIGRPTLGASPLI